MMSDKQMIISPENLADPTLRDATITAITDAVAEMLRAGLAHHENYFSLQVNVHRDRPVVGSEARIDSSFYTPETGHFYGKPFDCAERAAAISQTIQGSLRARAEAAAQKAADLRAGTEARLAEAEKLDEQALKLLAQAAEMEPGPDPALLEPESDIPY